MGERQVAAERMTDEHRTLVEVGEDVVEVEECAVARVFGWIVEHG